MIGKEDKVILVTGATGHQGREVVNSLLKNGWIVDAFTRGRSDRAVNDLKGLGARVVIGDMEDRSSLDGALKGVYGVFLVTTPFEGGISAELKKGKMMTDAAKAAGVKHLVFSSVGASERKTGVPFFENKREIELYIMNSGLPNTIFKPVSFMINFEEPGMRNSILGGVLRSPYPEHKKEQYVALEDLGAFVNIAFENPDTYIGKEIELASDELTLSQVADSFSMILGQRITYERIPAEEIKKMRGDDYYKMVQWHLDNGFKADIGVLRKIYPRLSTFDSWLRKHEWNRMRIYNAA